MGAHVVFVVLKTAFTRFRYGFQREDFPRNTSTSSVFKGKAWSKLSGDSETFLFLPENVSLYSNGKTMKRHSGKKMGRPRKLSDPCKRLLHRNLVNLRAYNPNVIVKKFFNTLVSVSKLQVAVPTHIV